MPNDHWKSNILDEVEKEQEQLRRLDKFRRQVQNMLCNRLWMIAGFFILALAVMLVIVGVSSKFSPTRYLARLTLCFQPKHPGDDQHKLKDSDILRILKKHSTREVFAARLDNLRNRRRMVAANTEAIQITTDRKKPHIFSIALYAGTNKEAVTFINEFSSACIREYVKERSQELEKWKSSLEAKRQETYKDIQEREAQLLELTVPLQMTSDEDYRRVQKRLSEIQVTRDQKDIIVRNLTLKKKNLEAELGEINPAMLANQKELLAFFSELATVEKEITAGSVIYADENPKMLALRDRRQAIQLRLDAFCREKGIRNINPQSLRQMEALNTDLKALMTELETTKTEKMLLDKEIEESSKRLHGYNENQPKLQRLKQESASLHETYRQLNKTIDKINLMLLVVDEDLFPNELAKSAVSDQPFAKKNVLICIFAALSLTALFATLIAVFEYLFGAVADSRELAFYDEFHYLGVLPTSEEMFSTAERKTVVFNTLFHNFLVVNPQVVFTGALTGARIIPQFFDFLKWNFSMEGKRMLTIEMVQAEHFDAAEAPDDESLGTMIVTFADGKCYLPVASKKYLVPAELELLKNDFRILREHYDYIFIKNSFPLRRSKLFLEQVASICNAALYAVGAGKTPRKNLRELLSVQQKLNIPIMTILSENTAGKLNKDLMREDQQ